VSALKAYRPTVGTAPQEFVQRASVVAWNDERHVEETRARYAAKRDVMIPAIAAQGWEIVASEATMYLWVAAPGDTVDRLLDRGLRLVPLAGRRDDAELREHRCLGGPEHDDRHMGDRRLVRADRCGRPPLRLRRDRRRARTGAGAARDRRGRRVHRLPLHPR